MQVYVVRRLLASIPVLVFVAVATFSIIHIVPGDAAHIIAGDDATPQQLEEIRKALGLDRPFLEQFGSWLGKVFRGDLGTSLFSGWSIGSLLLDRLEPTLSLAISSLFMSALIGIPLGVLAAWRAHKAIDRLVMVFVVLGFSIPGFWLGLMFIWAFGVNLHWFPVIGFTSIFDSFPGFLRGIFLPSFNIAIHAAALIARMTRSSMLEVLSEDYIRTARAKGLEERYVLVRHALKAASLPVVTIIGLMIAGLLTGVVVTETVFTIPGVGRLIVEAVARRDLPIIQAVMILVGTVYVFVNLLTDLTYAYLDPRVRY
ncbi:MAG: ABC transporter permease [Chloroflexota bacterium]|nr:ABC transporter permease [Chloroflexota bacterium]